MRYNVVAARAAAASYGYEDAIRHYEDALGLITEVEQDPAVEVGRRLGQDEVALRRELATAQRFADLVPQAFRNFRIAFRMAQARGDRQAVAELALEQVQTGFVPGDLRVRTLAEGLEAVPDSESELAAVMDAEISQWLGQRHQDEEAEAHRRQAEELAARHGYRAVELLLAAFALGSAVGALDLGRLPELERSLAALELEVGRAVGGIGVGVTAIWPLMLGEVSEARQKAERLLEAARRARDNAARTLLIRVPASAHFLLGEFGEVPRILELDQPHEPDTYKTMARAVLADARGDLEGARAGAEAAVNANARLRIPALMAAAVLWLAGLERRAGDRERARTLYSQALEQWESLPPEQQANFGRWGELPRPVGPGSGGLGRCAGPGALPGGPRAL